MTGTHDPRNEVEKLRAHLATHDKPLGFLIGAGASCAVKDPADKPLVPAVAALTTECVTAVNALGSPYGEILRTIAKECEGSDPNIEELLTSVRRKVTAMADGDKLAGGTRAELVTIEETVRSTIAQFATPADERIPNDLPHHALGRWIGRIARQYAVEIYTTNYDTLIERGLEDERVSLFDGFVGSRQPYFSSSSLISDEAAPARGWARLWKIHGSVNWTRQSQRDGSARIIRGPESPTGEMILPSFHKYDESRKQPYVAMLDRLNRFLTKREDAVLFTLGYSFGDEHVNEVIFEALDTQPRVHLIAIQFADPTDHDELTRRALRRKNLLVYGPTRAIVGGTVGEWRLLEPVDNRTAGFLDVPFDSDAEPEPLSASLAGKFRLGDFNWFARFLDGIAGVGE
ncbi:MAG: SIR2 family NAD-dependent protein deacylase [Actinomycetota bacterium]